MFDTHSTDRLNPIFLTCFGRAIHRGVLLLIIAALLIIEGLAFINFIFEDGFMFPRNASTETFFYLTLIMSLLSAMIAGVFTGNQYVSLRDVEGLDVSMGTKMRPWPIVKGLLSASLTAEGIVILLGLPLPCLVGLGHIAIGYVPLLVLECCVTTVGLLALGHYMNKKARFSLFHIVLLIAIPVILCMSCHLLHHADRYESKTVYAGFYFLLLLANRAVFSCLLALLTGLQSYPSQDRYALFHKTCLWTCLALFPLSLLAIPALTSLGHWFNIWMSCCECLIAALVLVLGAVCAVEPLEMKNRSAQYLKSLPPARRALTWLCTGGANNGLALLIVLNIVCILTSRAATIRGVDDTLLQIRSIATHVLLYVGIIVASRKLFGVSPNTACYCILLLWCMDGFLSATITIDKPWILVPGSAHNSLVPFYDIFIPLAIGLGAIPLKKLQKN